MHHMPPPPPPTTRQSNPPHHTTPHPTPPHTNSEGEVEFKEGTWEVVVPDDCEFSVTINGTVYKMAQFHFHNAEHTVN
jgi:carbonic anhydrase